MSNDYNLRPYRCARLCTNKDEGVVERRGKLRCKKCGGKVTTEPVKGTWKGPR